MARVCRWLEYREFIHVVYSEPSKHRTLIRVGELCHIFVPDSWIK